MPHPIASATKLQFREAVAKHPLVSDWFPGLTTGAGSATAIVDSGLSGEGDNNFQEWYTLITDATSTPVGKYRTVDSFTASTLTLRTTMTDAAGNDKTYYLHKLRPDWYTWAYNTVRMKLYPLVYRQVTHHIFPRSGVHTAGLPRNMDKVFRIYYSGRAVFTDDFNRTASTTDPGNSIVETTGSWGVIGQRLYSVSDADADIATIPNEVKDGVIEYSATGTTNHDTVYRTFSVLFRVFEDETGALDTDNCLLVRLLGTGALALVDLRKRDGGTEASLATAAQVTVNGTYYTTRVEMAGTRIVVWVNDVALITHELVGSDVKYLEGKRVQVRLDKAGSPGTDARLDNLNIYTLADYGDVPDARKQGNAIIFPSAQTSYMVTVEGGAPLAELAADTAGSAGAGTIASDDTATIEMQTSDPAWGGLLVVAGAAEVLRTARSNARSEMERTWYDNQLAQADALVARAMETHQQPRARRTAGYTV